MKHLCGGKAILLDFEVFVPIKSSVSAVTCQNWENSLIEFGLKHRLRGNESLKNQVKLEIKKKLSYDGRYS